jgi:hypothetical protein
MTPIPDWVPDSSSSTYPGATSIPVYIRGLRTGSDTDRLFTINAAEIASGFQIENSHFRVWAP